MAAEDWKAMMLQVSRQAGEHVPQETSMGIVNLDLLIGSLEEAFSICLQRDEGQSCPKEAGAGRRPAPARLASALLQ